MVYDFERNKLRQKEIEVRALVALMRHGNDSFLTKDGRWIKPKKDAEEALYMIAFPEILAAEINQEKLEYQ